jgi:hypothetical protein
VIEHVESHVWGPTPDDFTASELGTHATPFSVNWTCPGRVESRLARFGFTAIGASAIRIDAGHDPGCTRAVTRVISAGCTRRSIDKAKKTRINTAAIQTAILPGP